MADCYIVRRGGAVKSPLGLPEFTYTGNFTLLDDGLADDGKTYHWRIKFLTSGKLKFTNLGNAKEGIDLFLVGGGGGSGPISKLGGGGGGGYTKTVKNIQIAKNTEYDIVVGAGGGIGVSGGVSSAFNNSVNGGQSTDSHAGGNGGSGGGGSISNNSPANDYGGRGGSDGNDGSNATGGSGSGDAGGGGKGQGTTTREFAETSGTLYSGGGGGMGQDYAAPGGDGGGGKGGSPGTAGTTNRGGGGGGWNASGGSGIVIIRNRR